MGVPAPIDTWLVRGILAYRAGGARPVTMSDGPSGELFRSRGQAHIRARLTDAAHQQYAAVRDRARAAVATARGGDFDSSRQQFDEAETFLAALHASEEVQLLARSWIDQAHAYLSVRIRDWDEAQTRLQSAMDADLALEERFGYEIFHIGRVHTVHLWLRALGESGDRVGAVTLAQAVLDYLHGARDTLPIGSGWSGERAALVPDDLKLAMTMRICSEIGTQLAAARGDEAAAAFAVFTSWRNWDGHAVLHEVFEWARAKEAFIAGDTRAFLERVVEVLAKGRRESTVWYAAADDFSRVCAALRPEATSAFVEEVAADAASWRQLPPEVQAPALFALMAGRPQPRARYRHVPATKRFEIFTVGLPRTGTTSLHTLFANFRSGNEFMERETVTQIVEHHRGALSERGLRAYLDRRHTEGDLEMDSASFHHLYLDTLLDVHPGARLVMTVREPYEWANSYIKMIAGWHQRLTAGGEALPQWMEDYGAMLFGEFSWTWVASPASLSERLEPLADAFLRHWAEANRRVLERLPRDRSIVLRTEALSQSVDRLARFAGVPAAMLTDQHHSNAHPDRSDLMKPLGRDWVAARVRTYGPDVLPLTAELVPV